MTRISIDAAGIADLGRRLGDIAAYLTDRSETARDHRAEDYGFVDSATGLTYSDLFGSWERRRGKVCAALTDLEKAAQTAGGVYVETERGNVLRAGGAR